VIAWLDRQPAESVRITSITLFEARLGLALLPTDRRRQTLEAAFTRMLLEIRVLDFDSAAATEAASIAAERRKTGRPVDMRDTRIAGIALARRATLATRNVRHFGDLKVPIVNPWAAPDEQWENSNLGQFPHPGDSRGRASRLFAASI